MKLDWDRIKIGWEGFKKDAKNYLPKGLIFVPLIFAGSAIVAVATGIDPLGVIGQDAGTIVMRMGGALALGSVISGGLGAYDAVQSANRQTQVAAIAPHAQRQPQVTPERQPQIEVPKLPAKTASGQRNVTTSGMGPG